jgi:cytochrome P450 family 6
MVYDDFKVPGTAMILPRRTNIFIPILGIHSDPDIYPNPENFDPNRFSVEQINKRHPFAYLPFGNLNFLFKPKL